MLSQVYDECACGFRCGSLDRRAGSGLTCPLSQSNDLKVLKNVVNGEAVDAVAGATYDVVDPTTGTVYATAPASGAEDVDRAYAAAAAAFETWGRTSPKDRSAALLKIADAIDARAEEITAVE